MKMTKRLFSILFIAFVLVTIYLLPHEAVAQKKKKTSGNRTTRQTSELPAEIPLKKAKGTKHLRIVTGKNKEQTRDFINYRKKQAMKMEYEMEKPQYKDPLYFGHKRKPKKRPPGKQKFCKECGMKH
jgi:hypothetical protein